MGIRNIEDLTDNPDDLAPDADEPGDKVNHEIASLMTPKSETLVPDNTDLEKETDDE